MIQPAWTDLPSHLAALQRAAFAAADPEAAVRSHVERHLESAADGVRVEGHVALLDLDARLVLIAFGKASLAMARGALAQLGDRVTSGVVVHPVGASVGTDWPSTIALSSGGHPVPNEGSLESGRRAAQLLEGLTPSDLVLVLVSGGGSAMLEILPPGLALTELSALTLALQHAGADITELNTVRRTLSLLKGGGLARLAHPARTITLLLSDVLGDRLEAIASGPTTPSPTGPHDALEVLARYDLLDRHPVARRIIEAQAQAHSAGRSEERSFAFHAIVGSNHQAAAAVEREASRLGFHPLIVTTHVQGEAREVGRMIGGLAWSVRRNGVPVAMPACLILGGETTVTVRGEGKGGRNQELALGAALSLDGCERAAVFSFATDGVDGKSDAAGAFATGTTMVRARAAGLSAQSAFELSDTGSFFEGLGDLWVTGPSGTNVNDLAIVLVYDAVE